MRSGYVALHRKLQEHALWRSRERFDRRSAWIDLFMSADRYTGMMEASQRYLAARWRWPRTNVRRFLAYLEEERMIQIATGPCTFFTPIGALEVAHDPAHQVAHLIICNYFDYQKPPPTSRPTKRPKYNKSNTTSYYLTTLYKQVGQKKDTLDPLALPLAKLLRDQLKNLNEHRKLPSDKQLSTGPKAWAKTIDLMITKDNRKPNEIQQTIVWLFGPNLDAKASFVVESASSLRLKYDRIQTQRQRAYGPRRPTVEPVICKQCPPTRTMTVHSEGDLCSLCEMDKDYHRT